MQILGREYQFDLSALGLITKFEECPVKSRVYVLGVWIPCGCQFTLFDSERHSVDKDCLRIYIDIYIYIHKIADFPSMDYAKWKCSRDRKSVV